MPTAFTTGDNNFSGYQWIVDPTPGKGTHTTIGAALTSASAGDTICVRSNVNPYIENFTLKNNVNIVASPLDPASGGVIIKGKISTPTSGSFIASITGVSFQTNGDYFLSTTGSNSVGLLLDNCCLATQNFDGINSTNTSATIYIRNWQAGLTDTYKFFVALGNAIIIQQSQISASGTYTTINTVSAGGLFISDSAWNVPVKITGTGFASYKNSRTVVNDVIALDYQGSAGGQLYGSVYFENITATNPCINIATGCQIQQRGKLTCVTGNTNAITGAGTAQLWLDQVSFQGGTGITVPTINPNSSAMAGITTFYQALSVPNGGTGQNTLTNHGVLLGQGTSGISATAAGSTGQVLQSGGASGNPTYSTPTYPSASGTSRKILVSDGTNNVYSTETWAVPGSSGNVLTSDGTNWTSAALTSTGSWTPAITGSSSNPTVTYTTQVGVYYAVGNIVFIKCNININTISGGSGDIRITGLPFTPATDSAAAFGNIKWSNVTFSQSNQIAQISSGTNYVFFCGSATGTGNTNVAVSGLSGASVIQFSMWYFK